MDIFENWTASEEEKGFENFEVKALAIVVVSLITPAVHAYSAQKSTISDRVWEQDNNT